VVDGVVSESQMGPSCLDGQIGLAVPHGLVTPLAADCHSMTIYNLGK